MQTLPQGSPSVRATAKVNSFRRPLSSGSGYVPSSERSGTKRNETLPGRNESSSSCSSSTVPTRTPTPSSASERSWNRRPVSASSGYSSSKRNETERDESPSRMPIGKGRNISKIPTPVSSRLQSPRSANSGHLRMHAKSRTLITITRTGDSETSDPVFSTLPRTFKGECLPKSQSTTDITELGKSSYESEPNQDQIRIQEWVSKTVERQSSRRNNANIRAKNSEPKLSPSTKLRA